MHSNVYIGLEYPKNKVFGGYMDDKEKAKDPLYRIKNLVYLLTSGDNYRILLEGAEKENAKLAGMPVVMGARMHTCHDPWNGSHRLPDDFPRDFPVSESSIDYYLRKAAGDLEQVLEMPFGLYVEKGLSAVVNDDILKSCYLEFVWPPKIEITFTDMTRHVLPPTMAHEYAHFLQDMRGIAIHDSKPSPVIDDYAWNFKPLIEGFARGVERILAEQYADKNNDRLYLVRTQERICTDIDIFFNEVVPEQNARWSNRVSSFDGHWGTVAFLVLERKFGRGIYKQMMDSDEPYEMLIRKLGGRR